MSAEPEHLVANGAPVIIYRGLTLAPAVVGTSSLEVLVWMSMNAILTNLIRVAPSAPVPIPSGPIHVLAEVDSSSAEVHV
jgi:hypothetical protein